MAIRVPQVSIEVANQPTSANIRVAQVTVEVALLPLPLAPWCGNPPSALIGQPYSFQLPFPGGFPPYTWAIASGSLPPGLSLNPSTGVISGTPTGVGFTCQEIIHFDENTVNDQNAAMNSSWRSGLMRGAEISTKLCRVGAVDVWAVGNGPAIITIANLDNTVSLNPPLMLQAGTPVNLSEAPGYTYATRFDLNHQENWTFTIGTNSIDSWWQLSAISAYQKPDMTGR